jgi:hypothetical protein
MEDQKKYQAAKWQPWKVKQLQELSTVFENATLQGWKKIAADSEFAELSTFDVQSAITDSSLDQYYEMGYWTSCIGGPKNYTAFALHKTPYSAPLFLIELVTDVVDLGTKDIVLGELRGPLMCLGLKGGDE